MLGEYHVATKKLERTLEKTRQDMVKVMKGVNLVTPPAPPHKKKEDQSSSLGDITIKSSGI